ncbi:tetratricopeptide repeat protein [Thermophagus xiamenensis]|uniref:Tfp pilus assembly protein PilF n=1 Tax=Thermophagus xiamenensis TaxID=385682 RepID=A0A1I1WIG9_9BACT|nr:tetratricopeptide repeat protein [Thermophagus xiamenensis]SFD94178.1 Tfp pilus assembly protein PilF [Thermophagus xiamenensis]
MQKTFYIISFLLVLGVGSVRSQIDTDRMTIIGRNALYFEDYILAIQYFNQIIKAKPFLAEPYFYRALGKYYLEDFNGALNDCNEALKRNPYLVDAYNLRGILYQKLNKPEASVTDFKQGLKVDPLNVNLLINLGIAYIQTEQYDKAIETYSDVLKLSPNLIRAYLNRGLAKFSAQDTSGALEDFSKAIDVNPYIPDGYVNRSMIQYYKSDFEGALSDINEAIKLRPDESSFYMNRAIIRYQLDDLRGAMADFDKFVAMEPRNALGYNNRGILRAEIGDLDGAIEDFSRVLALREDDLPTLYYRAMLYKEKGEFEKALSDFNIVADAYPDFAPVYYNRAEVKQALGQFESAQLDYNTAMKLEMDRRNEIDQNAADALAANDQNNSGQKSKIPKRKATKKEGDRNIRNYNKIAVLDDFGTDQVEQLTPNTLRGKIQNRNIAIDLQRPYGITFFPGDTLVHRVRYFKKEVEELSNSFLFSHPLEISNATIEPDRDTSAEIFKTIADLDKKIDSVSSIDEKIIYLMERGLLYLDVLNLNNAIDNFNQVIELRPNYFLGYFARAFTRFRMEETLKELNRQKQAADQSLIMTNKDNDELGKQTRMTYEMIITDLQKVAEINPNFEFAWFNLGYFNSLLKNFDKAVKNYTKAIEENNEFAEAYFNRGLIRIYQGKKTEGTLDLSKAGELGVFEAYSVIKRYGSYEIDLEKEKER